jgi:outer membrane protein with beta-barrel domain
LAGYDMGTMTLGAGLSLAMGQGDAQNGNVIGTADTNIAYTSTSSVITLRAGGSYLTPDMSVDLGLALPISSMSVSYTAGLVAGDQNDKVEASNTALNFTGRAKFKMAKDMSLVGLLDFVSLPQQFKVTDNGATLGTADLRVDDTSASSFGLGAGLNWDWNKKLLNVLLTASFGGAQYTSEFANNGTSPRPEDSMSFSSMRLSLNGEYPLNKDLILRGGLGGSIASRVIENKTDTGGFDSKLTMSYVDTDAAAGLNFIVSDTVDLDFVLNLTNFATANNFGTLAFQAGVNVLL